MVYKLDSLPSDAMADPYTPLTSFDDLMHQLNLINEEALDENTQTK